jgi:cytoskeletal protein CcmA (bactofilin family)
MAINQITSANTFDHWLIATQLLVSTANALTDGPNFEANTALDITGTNAQLNVRSSGSINTLYANAANIATVTFNSGNMVVPGNVTSLNVSTKLDVGSNVSISGNISVEANATIGANLHVTGNIRSLQSANIAGNITGNNLYTYGSIIAVGGLTTSTNISTGNANVNTSLTTREFAYANANGNNLIVSNTANINILRGNVLAQLEETMIAVSLILG